MSNLKIENGKVETTERASPKWYAIRNALEGRKQLLKDGRVKFENTQHNISLWLSVFPDATVQDVDADVKAFNDFVVADRPEFSFKREPLPHQLKAFNKFKDGHLSAIFGDVGSGKSQILSAVATNYFCSGKIDAIIIVALNKLICQQWNDTQLDRDVAVDFKSWVWGKGKKDVADYEELKLFDGLQVININVDALRTDPGVNLCEDFIAHHKGRVLFAVDESQTIKTPGAARAKNALRLAHMCSHRSILSGTPISKDLVDFWNQFKCLDPNIIGMKYETAFKRAYTIQKFNGFANVIIGYQNEEKLYAKTDPYVFRITKQELGFRDYDDEFEFVLGAEEKKHYQSLKKTFMTELDSGAYLSVTNALSAMVRLQQVSNGFLVNEDGSFQMLEGSRLKALDSWLETISDDKIVIWVRFKKDAEIILKHYGHLVSDISGNVQPDQRYTNLQDFIKNPDKRYALGTPKAAGVGVDGLQQVTNRAIYYSNSEHALDYWQSRARTSRFGGDKNAFYGHLIGKGTVDRKILQNLQRKEALSSLMLDDIRKMWENAE